MFSPAMFTRRREGQNLLADTALSMEAAALARSMCRRWPRSLLLTDGDGLTPLNYLVTPLCFNVGHVGGAHRELVVAVAEGFEERVMRILCYMLLYCNALYYMILYYYMLPHYSIVDCILHIAYCILYIVYCMCIVDTYIYIYTHTH